MGGLCRGLGSLHPWLCLGVLVLGCPGCLVPQGVPCFGPLPVLEARGACGLGSPMGPGLLGAQRCSESVLASPWGLAVLGGLCLSSPVLGEPSSRVPGLVTVW